MRTKPDVSGSLFGVNITKRKGGESDLITLFIEDDEVWHSQFDVAAFWIDDLINVLTRAKEQADCKVVFKP